MKKSNLFIGVLSSLCFIACNSNLEPINGDEFSNKMFTKTVSMESDITTGTLEFLYKGVYYTSSYLSVNDSIIEILDPNTKEVMDYLATQPNATTYLHKDTIEFLDNHTDFDLDNQKKRQIVTRTPTWTAQFTIFDDVDYKDRSFDSPYLDSEPGHDFYFQIPNLKHYKNPWTNKEINFNDKISSMKLKGLGVRYLFWEDDTYSGRVLIVDMDETEIRFPNLKKIQVAGSSKSWNDRISSMEIVEL